MDVFLVFVNNQQRWKLISTVRPFDFFAFVRSICCVLVAGTVGGNWLMTGGGGRFLLDKRYGSTREQQLCCLKWQNVMLCASAGIIFRYNTKALLVDKSKNIVKRVISTL